MPELPEVETVVRGLRGDLVGRTLQSLWYDWDNTIRPNPEEMAARIQGQTIRSLHRRAKYIVMTLDDGVLMIHLKMTGRLYVAAPEIVNEADRWVHVKFGLEDGRELRFSDSRKFGRVYVADTVEDVTGALGPEPLEDDFTAEILGTRLQKHKRAIKGVLLDQTVLAGVGNIYADEALHRAQIHPLRMTNSLSGDEITRLHSTIRGALNDGLSREGASISWYRKPDCTPGQAQTAFTVYDREGQPCQTCGHPIEKIRVVQRGTHFCPHCQRLTD
jgi:formamidopyrimidine-DNA glycosylase